MEQQAPLHLPNYGLVVNVINHLSQSFDEGTGFKFYNKFFPPRMYFRKEFIQEPLVVKILDSDLRINSVEHRSKEIEAGIGEIVNLLIEGFKEAFSGHPNITVEQVRKIRFEKGVTYVAPTIKISFPVLEIKNEKTKLWRMLHFEDASAFDIAFASEKFKDKNGVAGWKEEGDINVANPELLKPLLRLKPGHMNGVFYIHIPFDWKNFEQFIRFEDNDTKAERSEKYWSLYRRESDNSDPEWGITHLRGREYWWK